MKKLLPILLVGLSLNAFSAATPELEDLSKSDVENVTKEFGANFSHTAVAAPETDGVWGLEIGLAGGRTSTPRLSDVVDDSGGDGGDFRTMYHGGLILRGHFAFDLFAELTMLPKMEISDVDVQNTTMALGWNAGAFFGLPLDAALGINYANSELSFGQTTQGVNTTVSIETRSFVYWAGVSKEFFGFLTPYAKLGIAKLDGDVKTTNNVSIFAFTSAAKQNVSDTSGYYAAGANLQFFFFRLGLEASRTFEVTRYTGKLSVAF